MSQRSSSSRSPRPTACNSATGLPQRVFEICQRYEVLFIADEVITGFGRTGEWFGVQHWDIEPDIMTVAKAMTAGYLPLAATISRPICGTP